MKQDFRLLGRHFITYGVGVYLSKFIGFFMIPIYTAYLAPADYGVLELLDLTMYVVGMFVGLGITNSIIRFYTDAEDDTERSRILSTSFFYTAIAAAIINGALIVLSGPIARLIFQSGESTYSNDQLSFFVKIVATSGIMDIMAVIGRGFLQAEKRSFAFTMVSTGRFFLALGLNILFIVGMNQGVAGVLYSQIISSFFFFSVVLILMWRYLGTNISGARALEMMKYGAPLIISSLSMFIIHFSDRFFIERFSGLSVLGIYSLGYKFAMVLPALLYAPFEMIWNTQIFDLYKKGEDGRKVIQHMYKYALAFSLLFIAAYSAIIKPVVMIMANPRYLSAWQIVPFLLFAFLINGLTSITGVGTYFAKKTRYRAYATAYGAIAALAGYYFLIKAFSYWGAVITTFIAFTVRYVALSIYSQKLYKINYNWLQQIKLVLACVAAILFAHVFSMNNPFLSIIFKLPISVATYFVIGYIFGVWEPYELTAMRQEFTSIFNKYRLKQQS